MKTYAVEGWETGAGVRAHERRRAKT